MFHKILDAILESLDFGADYPVLTDVEISHIGNDESSIDEALEVFVAAFPQFELGDVKEFIMSSANWDNSIKATYNDQVIGIYLIGDRQLYKSLNNLQHWLKSRRVVAQSTGDEAVFITLQDL